MYPLSVPTPKTAHDTPGFTAFRVLSANATAVTGSVFPDLRVGSKLLGRKVSRHMSICYLLACNHSIVIIKTNLMISSIVVSSLVDSQTRHTFTTPSLEPDASMFG